MTNFKIDKTLQYIFMFFINFEYVDFFLRGYYTLTVNIYK